MADVKTLSLHFFETEASLRARISQQARRLTANFFDPYRPELHYMRGPGPKWREKHPDAAPAPEAKCNPTH
ncbi:MAG TPA: hypothetical protein VFA53_10365 [Xanthobacteraceae bacterium]|nr:hypothetical protein [Xanthobacteraceae bacterium]